MVNTNYSDCCLRKLQQTLNLDSGEAKAARRMGATLQKVQDDYIAKASNPNTDPGDLKAAEIKYQKVLLAFEAFSKMMQNKFQTLMQGIRALAVR